MMNAVERAAAAADTSPTPAQKEAGNYRKGHVKLHGLDISIENPAGSQRSGVGANGKPWSVSVPYHYGYIRRTMGADKDQVDVALNPLNPEVPKVHIVDQKNRDTGAFDEHKVFLGYHHIGEAKTAHENGFSDGFGHLRQMAVTETTIPWLKLWLHRGDTKKPFSQWMAKPRLKKADIDLADEVLLKFNPLHDTLGRFTFRTGAKIALGVAGAAVAYEGARAFFPQLFVSQPKTGSKKEIRQLAHQASRRLGRERMFTVRQGYKIKNGKIVPSTVVESSYGNRGSVKATRDQQVEAAMGAHVVHNHPRPLFTYGVASSPPSPSDVNAAIGSPKSVFTVYGHGGSVFRFSSTKKVVDKISHITLSHIVNNSVIPVVMAAIKDDPSNETNIIYAAHHGAWLGLRDAGYIKYNYRFSPKDSPIMMGQKVVIASARLQALETLKENPELYGINQRKLKQALKERILYKAALTQADNLLLKARTLNQRDVAEEHEEPIARGMASYLAWLGGKPAEMVGKTCNEYDHKLSADALPMDEMDGEMQKATRHLRYAFIRGGEVAHPINQKRLSKLSNIDVSFDDSAPQVSDALDDYQFGLIRSVNDGQRDTIKQVVSQGVMQGQPPAVIAARVRDAIGLTPSQAMQVLNFRNELQNLNKPDNLANAMSRTLRDQRFDRVITNAAVSGQDLPQDKVDQIVDAYKRRYIAYRAMTIARTESLRAANMGSMLAAQQMADQLGPDTVVTKKWIATMDNRTRETHRELHGQTVDGIDTPFVASDGAEIVYPHDPDAPAEETINCRCTLGFDYNQPDQSEPTDQTSDTREEA